MLRSRCWTNITMKVSLLLLALGLSVCHAAYEYVGCFQDDQNDRAFSYGPKTSKRQTVARCAALCRKARPRSNFFGLQNADECFCGGGEYAKYGSLTEDRCNMCCKGGEPSCDNDSRCGSGWVNSVYRFVDDSVPRFKYQGCFQDGQTEETRTMTYSSTSDTQTVGGCIRECKKAGFNYAGLQNSDECFCSKRRSYNKLGRLPEDRCNMCCQKKANCNNRCGSGWVNSVYKIN